MSLKVKQIGNNIFKVSASTQKELALTFLRFQEHYESPKFRNKIFTLGEYKKWYINKNNTFSYYSDWIGFNIPSYILEPFKQGLFEPLLKQEQWLVNKLKELDHKYYVIGSNDNKKTLEHELCHALYYLDRNYKTQVNKALNKLNKKLKPMYNCLIEMGYHKSVLKDEMNAYLTTEHKVISTIKAKWFTDLVQELKALRKVYSYKNGI